MGCPLVSVAEDNGAPGLRSRQGQHFTKALITREDYAAFFVRLTKNLPAWRAFEILFLQVSSGVPLVMQPPDNTRGHIHIPEKAHGLLRGVNCFVSQPGTMGESLLDVLPFKVGIFC